MSDASTRVDGHDGDAPAAEDGEWHDVATLPVEEVRELFVTLGKALRAYQLYDENNPVYQRFVSALAAEFEALWDELDHLTVKVTEDVLYLETTDVYRSDRRADSLAFLLFKDGIREITFLPGIEGDELTRFLSVLQGARAAKPESDDLITVLWERDLQFFRYHHVDVLAEGVIVPEPGPGHTEAELKSVLEEEVDDDEASAESSETGSRDTPQALSHEDFNPTLYSLTPRELDQLRAETEKEMYRDLRASVFAALFDRLEEPAYRDRQSEILGIFSQLMPNLLSRGELSASSDVLGHLVALRDERAVFDDQRAEEVDRIRHELSDVETVGELVQALEDGTIKPDPQELGRFLSYLEGTALAPLVRATEVTTVPEVRPVIQRAVETMAERDPGAVLTLFDHDDPMVVAGAARLAGRMKIAEAGFALGDLMGDDSVRVRLAAVDSARELRASAAASSLVALLFDESTDVRIAAAEALGALEYRPAAGHLEDAITEKSMRDAELNERIAFFEAFGRVAGDEGVPVLDKLLNGKGFLGRREPSEVRACAALGLGAVGTPAASRALREAETEDDVVVRSAVNRALKKEEAPGE